jgi:hypothetical protein
MAKTKFLPNKKKFHLKLTKKLRRTTKYAASQLKNTGKTSKSQTGTLILDLHFRLF